MNQGKIVVIGSMSMDLVVTSPKRPLAGETVIGEELHIVPGGKGANQAVAARRAGAEVEMVGAVGNDQFGRMVRENFRKEGVSITHLKQLPGMSTGTAHIVLAEGDNSIVIVQGANKEVTPEQVEEASELLLSASIVLMQLEIPLETVCYAANLCKQHNIPVILNPAPANALPPSLIEQVTFLTPNEHECRTLFGEQAEVEAILRKYPNKLILTEGEKGVRYFDGEKISRIPALSVKVTDTTGAGDTFNGVLAVALAKGLSLEEAIRHACAAASLSVTKLGAQGGMPAWDEIKKALQSRNEI
ncbi:MULTISPECIES: ribokinase [Thermoactinomyces]|jgi:ribokinase|uniref:Ribokinase n=1 Tax=Thermoactinomyces daqus TaxID=1329516 RepID=A0A7W2AHQ6_9BACL|nr:MULTISPECIES: ribokinase [Thermoactinomyces]MBA4542400.1 ribokinase [Thermoactinomyces daqus]MBH8598811.1 ribokinase [Thermoactinomyces sp. CICC 10523]MBH8604796.1 ribokinase [Thermoactinomyces sp. CICC 10522]